MKKEKTAVVSVRINATVKTRIDALALELGTLRNQLLKDLIHEKFAETL